MAPPTLGGVERWRRAAGVRVRAAAVASLAVAVALALGSIGFLSFQHRAQLGDLDTALTQQAQTLAAVVHQSGQEDIALPARLGATATQQVVAADGRVLAASADVAGGQALTASRPAPGHARTSEVSLGHDARYRVLAAGTTDAHGAPVTVVVAASLEPSEAARDEAALELAIGSPVLVVLVGLLTWWVAGRALRPVEAMRRQVAAIDAASLDARVTLPEARDEVWMLGGTLNRMLDRLESAVRAQRQFVSDASHELRSPLAALRTSVEVAAAHPASTDWSTTADVLLEEAQRVERLVADLLLLANADERGLQVRREDVDLDDLLDAEAARLRSATSLQVATQVAPVRVRGDREKLARVVRNLVDNAARHAASSISLAVRAVGDAAVVEVGDDGPGIPEADRERVFDRFVRLDTSRSRQQGGTGLGLAIVRQIVEAHGGRVAFVAPSVVRLTLPLAQ